MGEQMICDKCGSSREGTDATCLDCGRPKFTLELDVFSPDGLTGKITTTNKGWECPKCGNVWAPGVQQCRKCKKGK